MSINIILAFVPVVLGLLILRLKNLYLRLALFPVWLLFLPNTVYLLTDLKHIPKTLRNASGIELVIILTLFIILVITSVLTYTMSIYPFEKKLNKRKGVWYLLLIFINILVGIGLILGRVFRFNSWEVLIYPYHIAATSVFILSSVYYLSIILLFSIIGTLFYLTFTSLIEKLILISSDSQIRSKRK